VRRWWPGHGDGAGAVELRRPGASQADDQRLVGHACPLQIREQLGQVARVECASPSYAATRVHRTVVAASHSIRSCSAVSVSGSKASAWKETRFPPAPSHPSA